MSSLLDIAWAAGLYEGEGNINSSGTIRITQKDRWILDKLQTLFGGKVVYYDNMYNGIHNWELGGGHGRGFLLTIFTFLSPRRRAQVIKACKFNHAYNKMHKQRMHCARGHELSGDNVGKLQSGRRYCRLCNRIYSKNHRALNKKEQFANV